jgi:transposase
MTTIASPARSDQAEVSAGVDTHGDTHTAAALDAAGRRLGSRQFPATPAGYRQLLAWLRRQGTLRVVGVEGTGSYGAGLARYLTVEGVVMVEVDRPDRKTRRFAGKSDPIDAEAAARAALAQTQTGTPKDRSGPVEALRNLRVARRSAIQQRSDCQRQIKSLLVTAAEPLRAQLRVLTSSKLIETCAGLRPDQSRIDDPEQATKTALRHLARRHRALSIEIDQLDAVIEPLVAQINPALLSHLGIGPDSAGQLLVTAGQNADRLHSEAAFAMLCGVAPIPASSGKTHRHRLNRGGDRQANAALHRVIICRMRWDPRTRAYVQRRTQQGRTKKDIIRCLKRMLARELYQHLRPTQPANHTPKPLDDL